MYDILILPCRFAGFAVVRPRKRQRIDPPKASDSLEHAKNDVCPLGLQEYKGVPDVKQQTYKKKGRDIYLYMQ